MAFKLTPGSFMNFVIVSYSGMKTRDCFLCYKYFMSLLAVVRLVLFNDTMTVC